MVYCWHQNTTGDQVKKLPARTYQDAIEYLADAFDHDLSARNERNMRRAVEEAYRELPLQAYWTYYRRREVLNTVPSQSTGTISYTHSTRTVALTGSTFPSGVEKYRLIIGNAHYDIESRTSSTAIVLPELSNPGADVASGTAYTLYKSEYILPENFRRMIAMYDITQRRLIEPVEDSTEQMLQNAALWSPGVPLYYAIRNTGEVVDRLSVIFSAPPSSARGYDLMYDAKPRAFGVPWKYSTGTVSVSDGGTAVTGSGTSFPSNCAGCVIRFSVNSADEPTGPYGSVVAGNHVDNPYVFQTTISSYTSGTSVTLADAAPQAFSGVSYTISDPIDIEDGAMFTAFLRLSEAKYASLMNYDKAEKREEAALRALILAKESDKRTMDKRQLPIVTQQWWTISSTEG